MSNNILKFQNKNENAAGCCLVARVAAEEKGQALTLVIADGSIRDVFAHLSEVPVLKSGDRVLVQEVAEGLVVTGRLRGREEGPRPLSRDDNGRLLLEAAAGIRLQTGEACIELTSDGRIHVDSKEIYSIATGRMRLQGATVEIN
ncbi:glutathione S-transferase N-terminal domain-containing protein [Geoalkalibacter halelectricus]|uniref:Phage baseplate assembly protein V n=1 Tax=Geoalkalibacter halelectricus TaxID=2847045 RepID=A0ABY5ZR43_9BACT|nr:glutathione S-transferase N-terminal domain-containing protein [Geoalkalibacter halelectricus]MDO3379331.1 hypothetical protein [Geoalkalibacter halelectricus]UWZ81083.1 hypothetical protein L9S41_06725 [Geoalkalibacter halelectricus]